jgi:hypothetical protein
MPRKRALPSLSRRVRDATRKAERDAEHAAYEKRWAKQEAKSKRNAARLILGPGPVTAVDHEIREYAETRACSGFHNSLSYGMFTQGAFDADLSIAKWALRSECPRLFKVNIVEQQRRVRLYARCYLLRKAAIVSGISAAPGEATLAAVARGEHPLVVSFGEVPPAALAATVRDLAATHPCLTRPHALLLITGLASHVDRDVEFTDALAALVRALPRPESRESNTWAGRERARLNRAADAQKERNS